MSPKTSYALNDLVLFVPEGTKRPVLGRLLMECDEDYGGQKWVVLVVEESCEGGICRVQERTHRVWDEDLQLFARNTFHNTKAECEFVIYDALGSGKDWSAVHCE